MLNTRFNSHTARFSKRSGFTLVELLVVIGIIAILAGVALGPITSGIKKAQQSSGVQTTRTLALSEFQYATDNNGSYPFGATAADVTKLLFIGNYITDPGILVIGGSAETKYTGATPSTGILPANISYDFVEQSATVGLSGNTPDQLPVVLSCCTGSSITFAAAGGSTNAQTPLTTNPFGVSGVAVCYHSNSAKFVTNSGTIAAPSVALTDMSIPAVTAITAPGGG